MDDLKAQIIRTYGTRGRNFSNLCSAGYLETWLLPFYNDLIKTYPDNPQEAKARFLFHYNEIINELPWTEFVHRGVSAIRIQEHIIEKMNRNIVNGIHYLNIHGLGEVNIKKIESVLPEIQKKTKANIVRSEKDARRIFVRLEISQPALKISN